MERLCETYPNGSILFLKRALCTTIIMGWVLTTPIIICIYVIWNSLNDESDESFRLIFWSLFRILLFFIQIPSRYDVWNKLNKCEVANSLPLQREMLMDILQSNSWKCTQIATFIVSLWVIITLLSTLIFKHIHCMIYQSFCFCFDGYLQMCLLRWCYVSIFIFVSHILFIIYSLRNVKVNHKTTHYQVVPFNAETAICPICLQEEPLKWIKLKICKHLFHKQCIDRWFEHKMKCPLCLQSYEVQSIADTFSNDRMHQNNNALFY
eukprot:405382_1